MIEVTYRALSRSATVWIARFDLGDETANAECALDVAFKMNAEILSSQSMERAVTQGDDNGNR